MFIGSVTLLLLLKLQESCLVSGGTITFVVSFIQTISIIRTLELSAVTRGVRIIKGPLYTHSSAFEIMASWATNTCIHWIVYGLVVAHVVLSIIHNVYALYVGISPKQDGSSNQCISIMRVISLLGN